MTIRTPLLKSRNGFLIRIDGLDDELARSLYRTERNAGDDRAKSARPEKDRVTITLADIEAARRTIGTQVLRTPMLPAPKLSALTGAPVWVKYENLQVTNSFKERGAVNKLTALSADERARGVIAMSAGNHAQAVAYHARRLGIPATIVMPVTP